MACSPLVRAVRFVNIFSVAVVATKSFLSVVAAAAAAVAAAAASPRSFMLPGFGCYPSRPVGCYRSHLGYDRVPGRAYSIGNGLLLLLLLLLL